MFKLRFVYCAELASTVSPRGGRDSRSLIKPPSLSLAPPPTQPSRDWPWIPPRAHPGPSSSCAQPWPPGRK
eukprot:3155620-Pyramimonas_sp.AAC.1